MNGVELPDEDEVLDVFRQSVKGDAERSPLTVDLALDLGVHPKVVRNWLKGNTHLPAAALPTVCRRLQDFAILDLLELKVGRVAMPFDISLDGTMPETMEVQRFVREVGEALAKLAQTLEDGRVEDEELAATCKELDDVIKQCARLKHMLGVMNNRQRV